MSVLDRFLPRQEFDSYEDFLSKTIASIFPITLILVLMLSMPGPKRTKKKGTGLVRRSRQRKKYSPLRISVNCPNQAAHFFKDCGIKSGQCCHADPPPPVGILDRRRRAAQNWRHPHSR